MAVKRRHDDIWGDRRAVDHMMKFPRPSPSIFAYCKQSKTGGVEGLGMRLGHDAMQLQDILDKSEPAKPTSPCPTLSKHTEPISQGHCWKWHHKLFDIYMLWHFKLHDGLFNQQSCRHVLLPAMSQSKTTFHLRLYLCKSLFIRWKKIRKHHD